MMKKNFVGLFVLITLFITGCAGQGSQKVTGEVSEAFSPSSGEIKEIEVKAFRFGFEPSTIVVTKGDKVELHLESIDTAHGFALPDFGINENLKPGKDVQVEFVADKTGTFTFYCSVPCGSGHGGMSGKLIVE